MPQRLHRILRSIGSTIGVLISPNPILESGILCRNVPIVRVNRGDGTRVWIEIVEIETAVHECRIRETSLDGLINVQDI